MTNIEKFEKIIAAFTGNEVTNEEVTEIVEWSKKNIESLMAKAEKDAEKRAQKRAQTDILLRAVQAALTSEPQTSDAILESLGEVEGVEEISVGKVRSRLSQLVRDGVAAKDEAKIDGKRIVVYTLA